MSLITDISRQTAKAAHTLALLDTETKNQVLVEMAAALREQKAFIIKENESDLSAARDNNLAASMIDRLTLNDERIEAMAEGIEVIVSLDDPVGQLRDITERPNGIKIRKMRVPLGVVCMIYEARPNVTADAGALCFKSGNGVILRGGKEALKSSQAIASVMHSVLEKHNLPVSLISVIPDPDRALLMELMQQRESIDLIIPRGGEGLINFVTENSTIPVIQHYKGVCHLYVDKDADLEIVHQDVADEFLNLCAVVLRQEGVKINADSFAAKYFDNATVLADNEFGEEYLDLEIAIRVVPTFSAAVDHIAQFGSNHTEVICTKNTASAELFQRSVDASVVMVNTSSRFSDGSQLGLGAEIGIATSKLHAYGPMGLESLTTEKYLVNGVGQVRE